MLLANNVYTRECLALEVDTSFASRRVTRELERIVAERGAPEAQRAGVHVAAFSAVGAGAQDRVVRIEPGKPVQKAHVESFHGKLRDYCHLI